MGIYFNGNLFSLDITCVCGSLVCISLDLRACVVQLFNKKIALPSLAQPRNPADRMLISGPLLLLKALKFPGGGSQKSYTHSLSTHHTLPPSHAPSPEILVGNASPAKTYDSYTGPESPPPFSGCHAGATASPAEDSEAEGGTRVVPRPAQQGLAGKKA